MVFGGAALPQHGIPSPPPRALPKSRMPQQTSPCPHSKLRAFLPTTPPPPCRWLTGPPPRSASPSPAVPRGTAYRSIGSSSTPSPK
eukprot:scaffold8016_cov67-Isochrysis_galbana.AAC.2